MEELLEELLEAVYQNLKAEVEGVDCPDYTAICELFTFVPVENLIGYLPEEIGDKFKGLIPVKEVQLEVPLYYVVEKQLQDVGDFQETNGLKNIYVYEVQSDYPKLTHTIEASLEDNSEEAIQEYLDDNGYGDTAFKFIAL